jgi:hypothetical protein
MFFNGLQEAQRWMHKSEDFAFELAKNNQALFEDLATAQAIFPATPQLRELFRCDPAVKRRRNP